MATATLSYSNLQQHDQQNWDAGLIAPKSPEPTPEWAQAENGANAQFSQTNDANLSNKTNAQKNSDTQDSSDSDEMIYQDDKNREIRDCLKNIQVNDDPDKAYWNYFKTLLEQEGQEKAQLAYLNYIKQERVHACLQGYKAQEEAKFQWSERQRIKEEQLNHYKQLMNIEENAAIRSNQQALNEIDYFKSKWESYVPAAGGNLTPDMCRDLVNKGRLLNSPENLELIQQAGSYLPYAQDLQQIGHAQVNGQDLLEVDAAKYYLSSGLQDQKLNAQFLAQHTAQKMAQPGAKRMIGKDSNALDDIMADFQANGRDSTAPPSPRGTRAWGTTSTTPTAPIAIRPSLPSLRHIVSPTATASSLGNITSSVASAAAVNPLTSNSLPRGTEAELLRQLMLMNLGATSAQLQKQQQIFTSQAQYGLQLCSLADSQFRRRRVSVTPTECAFCRNNGEQPAVYRGHILKDAEGRVRCPILRDYTCRNCGATGDLAHTVKYCPLTPKTELSFTQLQKNLRMANGKRRGSQDTTQWSTCDSP